MAGILQAQQTVFSSACSPVSLHYCIPLSVSFFLALGVYSLITETLYYMPEIFRLIIIAFFSPEVVQSRGSCAPIVRLSSGGTTMLKVWVGILLTLLAEINFDPQFVVAGGYKL